jgi:hypothetical protein
MKQYLLALILIISASCSPLGKYRDTPEVKRWETEIQRFELLDRQETYPDNPVIFAGSSSIRLWETLPEDMYPHPVIQRGYGGAKLCDFAVYADRILYPHNSSAIVLFIANDISGNDSDKTPREVLKLFRHVIKIIRKEFPDTPVFWIGITPTESRWGAWPEIQAANNLIRDYCREKPDVYFISTESAFLNDKGLPRSELFLADRLHLNQEGYRVWNKIIRSALDKVLVRSE